MKTSKENRPARSSPRPCSLLGDALLPEIAEAMEECSTCGSLPSDMKRQAHPRIVKVFAMGALWKCNCVCMICGYFVTGKTATDAVQAWNDHRAPAGGYMLPDDCSDLNAENS
jgi:hypothetical protein